MGEYAFYSFTDEAILAWGVSTLPVPVPPGRQEEIFGGEKVRVDLLLDELHLFLTEYPNLKKMYALTAEALTCLAGVNAGAEGDSESAARFLQMGLEANPDSLLLRSNFALALQLQDRGEEALEQYEMVLSDPEGGENPVVRVLAARLYAENGEYMEAYRMLKEMARGLPGDDVFWDFLAEMKELAGVEEEEKPPDASCTECGEPLKEGKAFCKNCGKPV